MLTRTFCHMPGIGLLTERRLWSSGIRSWEEMSWTQSGRLPFATAKSEACRAFITQSRSNLEQQNPGFFAGLLPVDQHWRLFPEFRNNLAYLDIETTGMGGPRDYITTIALYDGSSVFTYVQGRNLDQFRHDIFKYRVIVTYNGKCFDIPFIERCFGIEMPQAHIDLRYVLKSLGYGGGLKGCEKQLGLDRKELDGVDGYFAVLLWDDYKRRGNPKSLETLLAYNVEDVVNLEHLMVLAYNLKLRETPFHTDQKLEEPSSPPLPFKADMKTIERIRNSWMPSAWR
jgi:uncharacterized protein YprB with RNaseH-like and TPR domain